MTDKEIELVNTAGLAAYEMAKALRKLCNKKPIRPADFDAAVDQLTVITHSLEALKRSNGLEAKLTEAAIATAKG